MIRADYIVGHLYCTRTLCPDNFTGLKNTVLFIKLVEIPFAAGVTSTWTAPTGAHSHSYLAFLF